MGADFRLRIEGAMLERLLEKCMQQGAVYKCVRRRSPRAIEVEANESSARILSEACRRFSLKFRIKRIGPGPAATPLRIRPARLAGLFLCAALCALFLSRIWLIDIAFTGSCAALGDEKYILGLLQKQGVSVGMRTQDTNAGLLEKQLLSLAGDYSYIGVRIQGIRLFVEASPEVPAPGIYSREHARDMIACAGGVIHSVTVHSGTACVKPGDIVQRGDVLIRGEEAKSKEENIPVAAQGEVIARCWYEGSAQGPVQEIRMIPTGRKSISSKVRLFGLEYPVTPAKEEPVGPEHTQIIPIGGMFVPFELVMSETIETRPQVCTIDPPALRKQLTALARSDTLAQITSTVSRPFTVAGRWEEINESNGLMHVRSVYEIYTDIAATRDALN